jgi:hypothetical protein
MRKQKAEVAEHVNKACRNTRSLEKAHVKKLDESTVVDSLSDTLTKAKKSLKVQEVTVPDELLNSISEDSTNVLARVQQNLFQEDSVIRSLITSKTALSNRTVEVVERNLKEAYVTTIAEHLKELSARTTYGKAVKKFLADVTEAQEKNLASKKMTDNEILKAVAESIVNYSPSANSSLANTIADTSKRLVDDINLSMVSRDTARASLKDVIDETNLEAFFVELANTIFSPKPFFRGSLYKAFLFLLSVWTFKESTQFTREFFDMILINRVLANSVVMSHYTYGVNRLCVDFME